jgi:CRISPR-associated protein Cas6
MFWQDDAESEAKPGADDIFDLVFKIKGTRLVSDHAFALSSALREIFDSSICSRIGVHQIRMAESGNGWTRPQSSMVLSRRARLAIRASQQDYERLQALVNRTLELAKDSIEVGASSVRKLSVPDALFAHAVVCDAAQSEEDFLAQVAQYLETLGIHARKMICGTSGLIRTDTTDIFTRSLMVASLKSDESIILQRHGIGDYQLLGCGLFVPHKSIEAVYAAQNT